MQLRNFSQRGMAMSKTVFTIRLDAVNSHSLVRHTWNFRPTTRVVQSRKAYSRSRAKEECRAMIAREE